MRSNSTGARPAGLVLLVGAKELRCLPMGGQSWQQLHAVADLGHCGHCSAG